MELTATETKLLRLGLDDFAHDGEVRNCAVKLFESLRRRKVRADDLLTQPNPHRMELGEYRMPFGKFRGRKLSEIDPGYLFWCLGNVTGRPDVTSAIEGFLKEASTNVS